MSKNKIKIWGIKSSPFVRKVMITLYEKNLAFSQEEVLPDSFMVLMKQKSNPRFLEISPLGRIPAIEVDDFYVSDSAVIMKFLEQKFPDEIALYPNKLEELAKVLWLENFSDNDFARVATRRIFYEAYGKPKAFGINANSDLLKKAIEEQLPPLLCYLENNLSNKSFFVGSQLSAADIAITTQLLALELANYNIDNSKYPKLDNFLNKMKTRASIKKLL
ncbi:MAG: glutathione S-transferase family protein [Pseudomonadota bacterium]|nr:glutathione S-transferase family protein [Pseudomonadota bacterium]